jgi:hypothetical protein
VKTCAVLTPRLGQSLDPAMARVQEPTSSNLRNCDETSSFQLDEEIVWKDLGKITAE